MSSHHPTTAGPRLVGTVCQQWTDVESKLNGLLASSRHASDYPLKVAQLVALIDGLLKEDPAGAQFLLFHRSITQCIGYSALHSLLCAVLCRLVASTFSLADAERQALVCAALTMNIGMTLIQDELALQKHRPTADQRAQIQNHPALGEQMLRDAGVTDELWLKTVAQHHMPALVPGKLLDAEPVARLVKILQTLDRFTAALSPRKSRSGKNAHDSVRAVVVREASRHDEVGIALLQILGVCPPGTYVRLSDGEIAVVLRRGRKPGLPLVACIINRSGDLIGIPRSRDLAHESLTVQEALYPAHVRVSLNLERMLKLMPKPIST